MMLCELYSSRSSLHLLCFGLVGERGRGRKRRVKVLKEESPFLRNILFFKYYSHFIKRKIYIKYFVNSRGETNARLNRLIALILCIILGFNMRRTNGDPKRLSAS